MGSGRFGAGAGEGAHIKDMRVRVAGLDFSNEGVGGIARVGPA
jgi:hypothetical protein